GVPGIEGLAGPGRRLVLDGELVAGAGTRLRLLRPAAPPRRPPPRRPADGADVLGLRPPLARRRAAARPALRRTAPAARGAGTGRAVRDTPPLARHRRRRPAVGLPGPRRRRHRVEARSEEHTAEL